MIAQAPIPTVFVADEPETLPSRLAPWLALDVAGSHDGPRAPPMREELPTLQEDDLTFADDEPPTERAMPWWSAASPE